MNKERGFSATEMMIIGGLFAGIVLGFSKMIKNQSNALKDVFLKIEVQNIHTEITELMSNEANCTATMMNISSAPPIMSEDIPVPAILQQQETNGTSQSLPIYESGKTYAGVKITSMEIRPVRLGDEKNPSYKLEIKYQIGTKIVGANSFSKKMKFNFSQTPSARFPDYAYKCTAGESVTASGIAPVEAIVQIPGEARPGNFIRTTYLDCPKGKKAVSCGFNDTIENLSEDSLACHVDLVNNRCVATIDADPENADGVTFQCICL